MSLTKRHAASTAQTADQIALALRFEGRNPQVEPQGVLPSGGVVNDLRGSDPSQWRTQISQYRDVVYRDLWPGIDLRLREQSGVLKYEFHVQPGASPSDIRLAYGGADGLALNDAGQLQISTPLGVLQDSVPVSYQDIDGVRTAVRSSYVLGTGADARFSFAVGGYQRDHELIIDPGVQYTTFLGGNAAETSAGIAVDAAGNVFVAGHDAVARLPDHDRRVPAHRRGPELRRRVRLEAQRGRHGAHLLDVRGRQQHGVRQPAGRRRRRQRLRHRHHEVVELPDHGDAFDRSLAIPPNCPRCATDNTDGFAFKLNATGSALTWSSPYLGGTDIDSPRGIAVDGSGNAYVTGETNSRSTSRPPRARSSARRVARSTSSSRSSTRPARRSCTRRTSAAPRSTTAGRSRSTVAAAPTCSAPRARPTSRPRPVRSTRPPTAPSMRP